MHWFIRTPPPRLIHKVNPFSSQNHKMFTPTFYLRPPLNLDFLQRYETAERDRSEQIWVNSTCEQWNSIEMMAIVFAALKLWFEIWNEITFGSLNPREFASEALCDIFLLAFSLLRNKDLSRCSCWWNLQHFYLFSCVGEENFKFWSKSHLSKEIYKENPWIFIKYY